MNLEDSGEIQKMREEARLALQRSAYFWFVMVATVVLAAGSSILISVVLTQRSERKLCAVVITSDDQWKQAPPIGEAGKKQAENMSNLRRDLGCPPYKEQDK